MWNVYKTVILNFIGFGIRTKINYTYKNNLTQIDNILNLIQTYDDHFECYIDRFEWH